MAGLFFFFFFFACGCCSEHKVGASRGESMWKCGRVELACVLLSESVQRDAGMPRRWSCVRGTASVAGRAPCLRKVECA